LAESAVVGNAKSRATTTVLQNAVNVGLSYQPLFLEYWTQDATNPLLDNAIQNATTSMQANP
jgi:hypothetical protein